MGVPAGFAEVSFDDSAWPAAFAEGAFPNTSPWSGQVSIPADLPYVGPASDPPPALQSADWVWTNQYKQAIVGVRAFRKTIVFPAGQPVNSLIIDIIADDAYSLYLNGLFVGSGQSYTTAQRWQVIFAPTLTVVIAVYAKNMGGPAGLLAAGVLNGCACGCGSPTTFKTDATWKYNNMVPADFIVTGFDDSSWNNTVVEGAYGISPSPWGNITSPTTNSAANAALSGAPTAPPATVITQVQNPQP